jgi:hypothetical protein
LKASKWSKYVQHNPERMKILSLIFLSAVLLFSCQDDEMPGPVTTVNMTIKAVYDGVPLVMFEKYEYPDKRLIRFQTFNFFISEVALVKEGGDEVKLSDIQFIDFSNNTTPAEAATPFTFSKAGIPAGNYKGLRLHIGVPAGLNNANAGQLELENPLKKNFTSHFWSDWKSFIFMKCEGIYDLDGNGEFSSADRGFEHHPGTNEVYQEVTLLKPIELEEGQPFELPLVVDILKIYENGGIALDLSDPLNKDTQEASDLPLAKSLMENFTRAMDFEF